jgi:hypothetical protein
MLVQFGDNLRELGCAVGEGEGILTDKDVVTRR